MAKIMYVIIYTDKWGSDYMPIDIWDTKEQAENRKEELNAKIGKDNIKDEWYQIDEFILNKKRDDDYH